MNGWREGWRDRRYLGGRKGRQEGVRVPQQSATCYFELVEGGRDEGRCAVPGLREAGEGGWLAGWLVLGCRQPVDAVPPPLAGRLATPAD